MRKQVGQNSVSFKQYNRGLCLKLIATGVCSSRIELSRKTQLTKMTISNIVGEFLEKSILVECEEELTEVCGRNPVILRLSEKAPKVIGLLIFRDRIEGILCDLKMDILQKESIPFQTLDVQTLKEYSCQVIDRLAAKEKNILGLGVAAIGPVDIRNGLLLNPPRFYGIQNVDILGFLRERYPWPICFDHDNSSAALAEKLFGVGKNEQDFIFLGISNGIGSGIIIDGEVYHNRQGLAPEVGHMSIDYRGLPCECGNRGCLEMYANTSVMLEKLRKVTGKNFSFAEFCQIQGDHGVDAIFLQMIEDISVVLVNMVNILQPELIVLGHDCTDWQDAHVRYLEKLINEKKLVNNHRRIPVRKAYFKKDALLVGAAANVVNYVFMGNLLFS